MPRTRIAERLSTSEVAAIRFPPIPQATLPLFESPRSLDGRQQVVPHYPGASTRHDEQDHEHVCECGADHPIDSDEEEEFKEEVSEHYAWPERMAKYPRESVERPAQQAISPLPRSTTSSADGYESFENTNNKKKRKIPLPLGDQSPPQGTSMSIPTQSVDVSTSDRYNQYYTGAAYSPNSGGGLSGAGRGRNGRAARHVGDRRQVAATSNGINTASSGKFYPETVPRSPRRVDYGLRRSLTYPLDHAEQQGIIGAAMANAQELPPIGVPKGQENVSLLHRQASGSSAAKDFTFEYPSDSAIKMGSSPGAVGILPGMGTTAASHGTQTGLPPRSAYPPPPQGSQYPPGQHPAPPPKPRRSRDTLRAAAAQRKEQQQYNNRLNPPKREDLYICVFCEYESIYGRPPAALIRQYELKDRRERKAKEMNRRRLEKMKAKGRKNRRGGRSNVKNPPATPSDQHQQPYDPQYDPAEEDDSQSDNAFFEDGYDDPIPQAPHMEFQTSHQHIRDPGRVNPQHDSHLNNRDIPAPLQTGNNTQR
jgi:hypothetical protein